MLLSFLLALSLPSEGAAYYFVDAGTRGMARGGAYVAGNEDLTAQYYNPAALINLDSGQVMLNFSLVSQKADFQRMELDESGGVARKFESVDNIASAMRIPSFGIAHHFGLPDTMFAVGLHPPYAPDKTYTAEGAQRYTLIDAKTTQFYAGISGAHQLTDWLTIGAGLLWNMTWARQSLALNVCNAGKPEDPDGCEESDPALTDLQLSMKMLDKGKLTGNVGVLITPHEQWAIGLSVMPPIDVEGRGHIEAKFSDDHWLRALLESGETRDDEIRVQMKLPLVIRSGVQFKPEETLAIEFAAVYEHWSRSDETRIEDVRAPLTLNSTATAFAPEGFDPEVPITGPVVIPQDYRNSVSYRLGTEWDAKPWITLRSGVYYEASAIPDKSLGVSLMDGNKIGYGVGATYSPSGLPLSFDIALSQAFLGTNEIRNSQLTQLTVPIDPTPALVGEPVATTIESGRVVGNGDLTSRLTMLSAGITWTFGKPTPRTHTPSD